MKPSQHLEQVTEHLREEFAQERHYTDYELAIMAREGAKWSQFAECQDHMLACTECKGRYLHQVYLLRTQMAGPLTEDKRIPGWTNPRWNFALVTLAIIGFAVLGTALQRARAETKQLKAQAARAETNVQDLAEALRIEQATKNKTNKELTAKLVASEREKQLLTSEKKQLETNNQQLTTALTTTQQRSRDEVKQLMAQWNKEKQNPVRVTDFFGLLGASSMAAVNLSHDNFLSAEHRSREIDALGRPIFPRGGDELLLPRITFRWRPTPGVTYYSIELYRGEQRLFPGKNMPLGEKIRGTEYRLEDPLLPGQYHWILYQFDENRNLVGLPGESGFFKILTPVEMTERWHYELRRGFSRLAARDLQGAKQSADILDKEMKESQITRLKKVDKVSIQKLKDGLAQLQEVIKMQEKENESTNTSNPGT